jgi:hypothetical protein
MVWIAVAAFLFIRHWRSGRGVGLVLTYVVSFGAIDWLASALFLLPWNPSGGLQFEIDGMRLSALAIIALAFGSELALRVSRRRGAQSALGRLPILVDDRAVNLYLIAGLALHGGLAPLAKAIPSIGALVGTGSSLIVVGVGLKSWNAWQEGRRGLVWLWLGSTILLPLFTVVTIGFLGYGLAAMVMVLAFVGAFYRPRWRVMVCGALFAYLGLSVYVTYMRDRHEIRVAVKEHASFGDRVSTLVETGREAEWFDPYDLSHLARVEDRLDQNWLVGASVTKLASGTVPFARGETIWDAVLAIVPRMFWSAKTVAVGSGDLVSRFTGLTFQGDTSVGIGQLMECYVNFGTPGVIIGFFIIGLLVTTIDGMANRMLIGGDISAFLLWYLPGLNLLNVGGSFVDVTSAAAAAAVMALLMRMATRGLYGGQPVVVSTDVSTDALGADGAAR